MPCSETCQPEGGGRREEEGEGRRGRRVLIEVPWLKPNEVKVHYTHTPPTHTHTRSLTPSHPPTHTHMVASRLHMHIDLSTLRCQRWQLNNIHTRTCMCDKVPPTQYPKECYSVHTTSTCSKVCSLCTHTTCRVHVPSLFPSSPFQYRKQKWWHPYIVYM